MRAAAILLVGFAACALPTETGDPAAPPAPCCRLPGAVDAGMGADASDAGAMIALAPVTPPFDVASTGAAIAEWPRIVPGLHSRSVTSYDRGGGNDDGFAGTYSSICSACGSGGERVVFDEIGPGVLRTLWFTSAIDGDSPLGLGLVRFYFDDETTPRIAIDADALYAGTTMPFATPLVATNHASSGGFASWAPLAYRGRLRVTTAKPAGFYQVHYDALPPDWSVASWTAGTDAALAGRFATTPSGAALVESPLETTLPGAGTIDVLRFVPAADATDASIAGARLRVTFDAADAPQIDVPLGLFFGSARGVAPVSSVAWTMTPSLFESRLPMPFWTGARISVTGIAGKLLLLVGPQRWTPAEAGTLSVVARAEALTTLGEDVVYADLTGAGKIVGTVLGIDPQAASNKQWWEGDMRTVVDGARTPEIHGTGHEDDHLGGWSNEYLSRPFSLPMQGCPRTDLLDTGAEFQKNGASTMYRLWPGIGFARSVRHSTEHGASDGKNALYATATFLYRQARTRMEMTDAFDVDDAVAATAHGWTAAGETPRSVTSAFEGESAAALTAVVHDLTGAASFTLAVDPANEGVELRRLFDRAEAPARSTLEVEGIRIGSIATWGPLAKVRSWVERDVVIPAQVTKGKALLHVRWIPEGTSKPNAARFEAWSLLR